jgi:DNA mismatch repair protein MutL
MDRRIITADLPYNRCCGTHLYRRIKLVSIAVLDPLVAQQVAAGEVVERPASVVKELVENSLDAGASRIEIDLSRAGAERISVRDNGSGMDRDDATKAVLRHATSKIRSVEDLYSVLTLGFRGEALPSIASVSLFTLTTSDTEGAGTRVFVDGGKATEVSPTAHPKGTSVVAEQLFFNVPARRAFMKSARAERAAIVEAISHLSVVHSKVAFKLTEGERELLSLPAARDTKERLAQLWGVERARALRAVKHEVGPFQVSGFAVLPSITDSSRANQTISVNGRWVKAESLLKGLDDAYRGTLPAGRYPPVALSVIVDPQQVDVNVHPAKQLVRFSDERAAREAVAEAVRRAIQGSSPEGRDHPDRHGVGPELTTAQSRSEAAGPEQALTPSPTSGEDEGGRAAGGESRSGTGTNERRSRRSDAPLVGGLFEDPGARRHVDPRNVPDLAEQRERLKEVSTALSASGDSRAERGELPRLRDLRVVGQIAAGYILVDEPLAAWIVDQHVAHERAILDRLSEPEEGSLPGVQKLLVPEVVHLSPSEAATAAEALEELAVFGFDVEPFGKDSFRINGVISTLAEHSNVAGAFKQAVTAIGGASSGMSREERILATIACHSAVKLGDRLAHAEMEALIKEWLTSRYPATCPHGRSICYRLDHKDIARKLDRH